MAIEGKLDLDMDVLIGKAADVYSNSGVTLAALDQTEISRFVRERLRVYLTGESNTAASMRRCSPRMPSATLPVP